MSDIEFLYHERYNAAIRAMIEDPSDLRIAVSYWGKRINEKLGLIDRLEEGRDNIKVICDLYDIACRHEPIAELLYYDVPVRRIKGLHAKVWRSTSQVIVGSANSSRTALHFSGLGIHPNEEAGVSISVESAIEEAKEWFDGLWHSESCVPVEQRDINRKMEVHSESVRANARDASAPCEEEERAQPNADIEHFVGDGPGAVFRECLNRLGMTQNDNNTHSIRYDKISDVETFADGLVNALRDIALTANNVDRTSLRNPPPIPDSFTRTSDESRNLISQRISDWLEEYGVGYLWVEEGDGEINLGHSLRLNNVRADKESISLLTFAQMSMRAAQKKPIPS